MFISDGGSPLHLKETVGKSCCGHKCRQCNSPVELNPRLQLVLFITCIEFLHVVLVEKDRYF